MIIMRTTSPRRPKAEMLDAVEMQKQLDLAEDLLIRRKSAAALELLSKLRGKYPRAGVVWLESAMALDGLGRESEAIPFYEQSLRLDLQGKAMRDALVCYASSLRNIGRSEEAIVQLRRASRRFPHDLVVTFFLALGYHDIGKTAEALRLLALTCLNQINDQDLANYRRPLANKFRSLMRVRRRKRNNQSSGVIANSKSPIVVEHIPIAASSGH
jgi:tetratricopeptide (TPR) repeat protein